MPKPDYAKLRLAKLFENEKKYQDALKARHASISLEPQKLPEEKHSLKTNTRSPIEL